MTFDDFLEAAGLNVTSFWGILIFIMSIGIEVVPKIKWSPWSSLLKWIGSKFNDRIDTQVADIKEMVDAVDKKVDKLQLELDNHMKESEEKAIMETRRDILEFANACMNHRKHTQEQFEFVISQCDEYELYIEENHIKNGVIESAIREIRYLYDKCRRENSFLKESGLEQKAVTE